jgi:hypothetical protein
MVGTVTNTFAYALANWAWAYINGQWLQISQSAGADSVTNMFVQLVAARSSGATVTVGLDANNQIYYVFY